MADQTEDPSKAKADEAALMADWKLGPLVTITLVGLQPPYC